MMGPSIVTEIVPETFRISTFHPDFGIQFNQFLIADAEPFMHGSSYRGDGGRAVRELAAVVAELLGPKA